MLCMKSLDILVSAKPQAVFNFLCSKPNILNDFKIKDADNQKLKIFVKSKVNWLSFGENIAIEITNSAINESTHITITSKPIVPITLVDWGRNQQNIERIAYYIYSGYPHAV